MQEDTKILGLTFINKKFGEILEDIDNTIVQKRKKIYFPVNVDMIVKSRKDHDFRSLLEVNPSLLFDGMPVIWGAKFLGYKVAERVPGADLFPAVCKLAVEKRYRVFFLGAGPGIAVKAADVLKLRYPNLQIAGIYSPPYGFEDLQDENRKIIDIITDANPDILFIGLGAPKQEKWIWKHKDLLNVSVCICIGAGFDFIAGKIRRAPAWMQRTGLEWLWRFMMEPQRLWKRYFVDDMQFFWLVLKQKYAGRLKKVAK